MINLEEMRAHAERTALEGSFGFRRYPIRKLVSRLDKNYKDIYACATGLSDIAASEEELCPGSTWILDNFYKIEEQVKSLRLMLDKRQKIPLGILNDSLFQNYPRIYPAALDLVRITNGNFNEDLIIHYLKAYQTVSVFSMGELWFFNTMLVLAVIERIRDLSRDIHQTQLHREKVKRLDFDDTFNTLDQIKKDIGSEPTLSPAYIEYLVRMIRREKEKYEYVFRYLDRKLLEYDTTIEKTIDLALRTQSAGKIQIGNLITSLNKISMLDWNTIFESVSVSESILRRDPAGVYENMDFKSRDHYRHQIEKLARKLKVNETKLALKILDLSEEAFREDPAAKRSHVGFYLVDKGRKDLVEALGFTASRDRYHDFSTAGYLVQIGLSTLLVTLLFAYYAFSYSQNLWQAFLTGLILFIPASEMLIKLTNWVILKIIPPVFLPKMALKDGIPEEASTLVVIPSLIHSERGPKELFERLETYYLANKDRNLYFALLGEFKDADREILQEDSHIVKAALDEVKRLNNAYAQEENIFFYFQRKRLYNRKQKRWICWERKRGSLTELGALLSGEAATSHMVVSSDIDPLQSRIRYIITLDEDTQLPMDSARKLIGTISHPLNQAVFDPEKGRVVEGYGFIQPSVSICVDCSNVSRFTRIYARNTGVSIYSEGVSDLYQDLFNEGIFMGKGIYDLPLFNRVLKEAIPENRVLSHDLLEGSHIRAAFATDIELIDNHPTKYFAYIMRLHRWVRGDWQLLPWLKCRVVNSRGEKVRNPLSPLSKWKILDNLRRSLYAPALLVLVAAALFYLPGHPFHWFLFILLSMFLPLFLELVDTWIMGRTQTPSRSYTRRQKVKFGIKGTLQYLLLELVFLPYEAYVALEAIVIALYRQFISKNNLLEWVPASMAEKKAQPALGFFLRKMWVVFLEFLLFLVLMSLRTPSSPLLAWSLALIWLSSPWIAYQISPRKAAVPPLSAEETTYLRREARRIWSFYEDLAQKDHHYLPPDNYQVYPPREAANRTSPTNIGLMMLATVSARDMGYLSITRMLDMVDKLLLTVSKLEKWEGHLFNWYNTNDLSVLRPRYVSSVDSGNFVGYLIALKQSLLEYRDKPLIDDDIVQGLMETCELSGDLTPDLKSAIEAFGGISGKKAREWKAFLDKLAAMDTPDHPCSEKAKATLRELLQEYDQYYTLIAYPEDRVHFDHPAFKEVSEEINALSMDLGLSGLRTHYNRLLLGVRKKKAACGSADEKAILLRLENKLKAIISNLDEVLRTFERLTNTLDRLVAETNFKALYDKDKHLFSIGYDWENDHLTESYYDLMASEARQASFLAIVGKQIPLEHWYRLGRTLTISSGLRVLASWSGTMFEYFMPHLLLKNYENTLMDETYHSVIEAQKRHGKAAGRPWGVSESAYYYFDIDLNYQYKAFGVPDLGFKRGLINDYVVAPYASFFALPFDRSSVLKNLRNLETLGMQGPYGFYESLDFTRDRVGDAASGKVVQTYMAHHLGMSLVAINNHLNQNLMQTRFHADPVVKTGEFLLQEKLPFRAVIARELREKARTFVEHKPRELFLTRVFKQDIDAFPRCHMLSNKRYQVMVTNNGGGFSRYGDRMVTRWREDRSGRHYGLSFYFRSLEDNEVWSAGFEPLRKPSETYEARFSLEKAEFVQTHKNIHTHMEIWVSTEDDVEVRRITLVNKRKRPVIIETTSYAEITLNTQAADIAHRAFSNLFIKTAFRPETESLIASRRPRGNSDFPLHLFHSVACEGPIYGNLQYETDRVKFIGRGRHLDNPIALEKILDNTSGVVLDPIVSLRKTVRLDPNQKAVLTFSMGVANTLEEVDPLIAKYRNPYMVRELSDLSTIQTQVETDYLDLVPEDIQTFQDMISQILYLSPRRKEHQRIIRRNRQGQSGLWPYGISGDLPIVLASIQNPEHKDRLWRLLKAKEYWRLKGLAVDLVILNREETGYFKDMEEEIRDMTSKKFGYASDPKAMGVFILNSSKLPEEDMALLYAVSRIVIDCEKDVIEDQIRLDKPRKKPAKPRAYRRPPFKPPAPAFREDKLKYFNGYGGFDEKNREYVLRLKAGGNTPAPWINVIANDRFGFTVSESGGGYTWAENSRENKLTPWTNDALYDDPHEVIYLKDEHHGLLWSATPKPMGQALDFEIRHGKGYSRFSGSGHEIQSTLDVSVPLNDSVKLYRLQLKNRSSFQRRISCFFVIRPVLGVSEDQTQAHIRTRLAGDDGLLITNPYNQAHPCQVVYLASSKPLVSFSGNREDFSGDTAAKLLARETLSNLCGVGFDPCGALQVTVDLAPGQEETIVFMMGREEKVTGAFEKINKYRTPEAVETARREIAGYWNRLTESIQVETPDNKFDTLLNDWLVYQTLSSRIKARTGFYQAGGAYGFRDQLQDAANMTLVDPVLTKRQILLHAAHQFEEGDVLHWWHDGSPGKGIRTRFSDDLLWLPYAVGEYLRITGDEDILWQEIPYVKAPGLDPGEHERYGPFEISDLSESLYRHCVKAMDRALAYGPHGLPLMGGGDWNDGMNAVGKDGRGESVWLGWFLHTLLERFVPLCASMNDTTRVLTYREAARHIAESIEKNAWDGSWYKRAFYDDGTPLGSIENTECMIASLPQSWAVLSGGASEERAMQAMTSLRNHLILKEKGILLLFTPPFEHTEKNPGYIKSYAPGLRENGGQYTHAAAWVVQAYARLGDGNKAYELFEMLNPINHSRSIFEANHYKVEPYVVAADLYNAEPHVGRGGWTWYTGAAGWLFKVGIEDIMGLRIEKDRMKITPCIPKFWKGYRIRYTHRHTLYRIDVRNPHSLSTGICRYMLDGEPVREDAIPLVNDGKTHEVIAVLK